MAIKTNIDHIDNVKEIKGFISYQDYVNLDCYQNYVKANGISPTDNTLSYIREKENKQEQQVVVAKKEVTANASAIISVLLGWFYAIWSILGRFISEGVSVSGLFTIYTDKNLIGILTGLAEFTFDNPLLAIRDIAFILSVLFAIIILVGSHANLKVRGVGKSLKVMASILFVLIMYVAIVTVIEEGTIRMGLAIEVLVGLLIFFINVATEKKVK